MISDRRHSFGASSQTSIQQAAQQPGSVVWFISFGDLLTLLVCFFFVLTPWDRLKPGTNNKSSQYIGSENEANNRTARQDGTSLATRSLHSSVNGLDKDAAVLVSEVPIPDCKAGDVVCDSEFPALLASVGTESEQFDSTSKRTVVIRICAEAEQKQEMLERIGRSLIRSSDSVVDMPVRIELLGGECGSIHVRAPYVGKVIGSVRLIRSEF